MKKKKALVMLAASFALTIGTLFAVAKVNGDGSIFGKKNLNDDFVLDNTTIRKASEEEDIYRAVMVSATASIDVKLSGVKEIEENLVIEHGSCAVFSNVTDSPIRGIGELSLQLQASGQLYFFFYLSYNPLNLNDILDGKYQDLKTVIYNQYMWGSQTISTKDMGMDFLDYRYFLSVIYSPQCDVAIQSMSVSTPCGKEPVQVPVGTFRNHYSEQELEMIPGDTPFIGNGSYYIYSQGGSYFINALQNKGKLESFKAQFEDDAGYLMVNDSMAETQGILIYQKSASGDLYKTFAIESEPYLIGDYELIRLQYAGLMPSMQEYSSWPGEAINEFVTDKEFQDMIFDPELPESCRYTLLKTYSGTSEEDFTAKGVTVQITFENKSETILSISSALKALIAKYENTYGFIIANNDGSYEWGDISALDNYQYRYSRTSSNVSYNVEVYFALNSEYTNSLQIRYIEYAFNVFPHNELEQAFGEGYFDDIISTNAKYRSVSGSSPSPVSSKSYYAKGLTEEEIETYVDSLVAKGWSTREVEGGLEVYLVDTTSVIPVERSVRFESFSGYHLLTFTKRSDYFHTSNFNEVLYHFNVGWSVIDKLRKDIENATGGEGLQGDFYYPSKSSDHGTAYWENYSPEDYEILKSVLTYKKSINRYVCASGSMAMLFTFEEQSGYVIMNIEMTSRYNYIDMVDNQVDLIGINDFVNSMMTDSGVTEDTLLYLFDTDVVSYYGDGSSVYLIGDKEDVTAAINSYLNKIQSSENVKYSEYLGRYINTVNGVEVQIDENSIEGYSIGDVTLMRLNYSFGNEYVEYVSYDDLPSIEYEYMDIYPSLHIDDEKHFVLSDNYTGYLYVHVDEGFANLYKQALVDAGFILTEFNDNPKNGTIYYFYQKANENGDTYNARFSDGGIEFNVYPNYYYSINEIKAEYSSDAGATALLNSVVLPNDNRKNFRFNYSSDESQLYYFLLDVESFEQDLLAAGFVVNEDNGTFYKLEGNNLKAVLIDTDERMIRYASMSFVITSNEEFVTNVANMGFDERRFDHFVDFNSFDGTLSLMYANSNSVTTYVIDPDFDIEDYKAKLVDYGYVLQDGSYVYGSSHATTFDFFKVCPGVFVFMYTNNERLYSTFDSIKSTILTQMSEQRFNLFVSPDDEGEIFSVNSYSTYTFSIYYNDNFDLDAYVTKIENAGYDVNGDSYQYSCNKEDSRIYIYLSDQRIYFSNYQTLTTQFTDELLEVLLDKNNFELSNECALPSISYDIYYSDYYTYSGQGYFFIVFNIDEAGDQYETSTNGNIFIETVLGYDGEQYIAYIYIADFAKNSDTFRGILEWLGIYEDSENPFVDNEDKGILNTSYNFVDGYVRTDDNESTFAQYVTFIRNNPGYFEVLYEDENEDTSVISFSYNGYVYYISNQKENNVIALFTNNEPAPAPGEDPEPIEP